MYKEELHAELRQKAQEMKAKAIQELGAVDFQFQVPNFDHPLLLIPSILKEIGEFGSALQEFQIQKIEEAKNLKDATKAISYSGMYGIWNTWNTVIGMVLTSEDPEMMDSFHKMLTEFAHEQILKTKNEKGN